MPTQSKLKIFLAEDANERTAGCKQQLQHMGYTTVFSFETTGSCLKRLQLKPDVVLLPLPADSPEGVSLQKKIHSFNRQIIVVFAGWGNKIPLGAAMHKAEKRIARRRKKERLAMKFQSCMRFLLSPLQKISAAHLPVSGM